VDVFGFSLGGLVGVDFAVRYPDRIGRLVAASVHYRADGYYPEIRDPSTSPAASTRLPGEQEFTAMRELIPDAQLAVLPGSTHTAVMRRRELVEPMVTRFLTGG